MNFENILYEIEKLKEEKTATTSAAGTTGSQQLGTVVQHAVNKNNKAATATNNKYGTRQTAQQVKSSAGTQKETLLKSFIDGDTTKFVKTIDNSKKFIDGEEMKYAITSLFGSNAIKFAQLYNMINTKNLQAYLDSMKTIDSNASTLEKMEKALGDKADNPNYQSLYTVISQLAEGMDIKLTESKLFEADQPVDSNMYVTAIKDLLSGKRSLSQLNKEEVDTLTAAVTKNYGTTQDGQNALKALAEIGGNATGNNEIGNILEKASTIYIDTEDQQKINQWRLNPNSINIDELTQILTSDPNKLAELSKTFKTADIVAAIKTLQIPDAPAKAEIMNAEFEKLKNETHDISKDIAKIKNALGTSGKELEDALNKAEAAAKSKQGEKEARKSLLGELVNILKNLFTGGGNNVK